MPEINSAGFGLPKEKGARVTSHWSGENCRAGLSGGERQATWYVLSGADR
jgi:hypothetical protein